MERFFKDLEEMFQKLRQDFDDLHKSFDEFFETKKRQIVEATSQTLEAWKPVISKAKEEATVTVKQEGDKLIAEIHGKAEVTDPQLREQILKHIGERKELKE